VFGWGLNNFSQLGLSQITHHSNVPAPTQLPVPVEITDGSSPIIDIMCGIRHSAVLTGSGKIWVTGGIRKEKAQVKKDLGEVAEEEKYDPELKFEKGKKDKSMKKNWIDPETGKKVEKKNKL